MDSHVGTSYRTAGAPASFDCAMRQLAYQYGRSLLPRKGAFESLYFALNLNDPSCNGTALPQSRAEDPRGRPAAEEHALPARAVFVAPGGRPGASGLAPADPMADLQRAVDTAAATGVRDVVLRGGTHYLADTLHLGPEHSNIHIQAFPGETPVVSGGVALKGLAWKPYNVSAGGANIYVANIKGQVKDMPGLQIDGVRATRARYPNLPGGIEVSPGYDAMVSGSQGQWTPPDFNKFGPVQFYTDNITSHTRNNTPDGWFQHYMIGINGLCSVYNPPVSYWCSEHPSGGGAFAFR